MRILITGGTGSLGKELVKQLEGEERIAVYSRDELKQHDMQQTFPNSGSMRYFLGDVRDVNRLTLAMESITHVIHGAALKQVPAGEYNPGEAIKTNLLGTMNVVEACNLTGVKKCILISTDKAVAPINLYGATKMCAEKYIIAANNYGPTKFSVCRYGNVLGSRGSVVPLWEKQSQEGRKLTITDKRMSRFWITIEKAAEFVLDKLDIMQGGEIYVPCLRSMTMLEMANHVAADANYTEIGIRPGEKLHEQLITIEESRTCYASKHHYTIYPQFHDWAAEITPKGTKVEEGFIMTSGEES